MEPQREDAWTEPIVIVPEHYLREIKYSRFCWLIGLSLLAFFSVSALYSTHPKQIYNAYDDDDRISVGGLILETAESSEFFYIPLYSMYVIYTMGKASVVGNKRIKYKFLCVACVCLITNAWGLMFLLCGKTSTLLRLFCGLLLLAVSVLALLYNLACYHGPLVNYLTDHKKFTIAEWNEKAKHDSNLPQKNPL
jgi:hypothetical protein